MKSFHRLLAAITLACLLLIAPQAGVAQTQNSRLFPETGHTVSGSFLNYWQEHGGLAQQGYPLSEPLAEKSDLDGKQYTVQYFERAVFEMHPENQPPYDVLLSQLGTFRLKAKYPVDTPFDASSELAGPCISFPQTGKSACGIFLTYWQQHGGLAQQGYPMSIPFQETSDLDGKTYTVQYFERAVFEMHSENQPPYNVLLSQLGTFQLKQKYPAGAPTGTGDNRETPQAPAPTKTAPLTNQPAATPIGQPTAPANSTTPPTSHPATTPTQKPGTNCGSVADSKKSKITNAGPVAIADVQYSGVEYVKLTNSGQSPANIGGWVLRDKNETAQRYAFPGDTQLPAGGSIQVYTEPGHDYTFNSKSAIWNNCGDALELLNGSGAVVATYAYGTHLLK